MRSNDIVEQLLPLLAPDDSRQIYLVGGYLRDRLTGYNPPDIDLVTEGSLPEALWRLASALSGTIVELSPGKSVYRVVSRRAQVDLEGIPTGGLAANLGQRDFTLNAMALSLADALRPDWQDGIIDPFGGREDIRQKRIRAVSAAALAEDPLRCLRAFRLAGKLGFAIEDATLKLIRQSADLIRNTAAERVWEELSAILTQQDASRTLGYLDQQTHLLEIILPEIAPLKGLDQGKFHYEDAWNHSLHTLECLETWLGSPVAANYGIKPYLQTPLAGSRTRGTLLKLACLLHDIGKPQALQLKDTGQPSFIGHARIGEQAIQAISARLKISRREREFLSRVVGDHMTPLTLYYGDFPSPRVLRRHFNRLGEDIIGVLLISLADYLSKSAGSSSSAPEAYTTYILEMLAAYNDHGEEYTRRTDLLNGRDIQTLLGIGPSPLISRALEALSDAQFEGSVTSREQAEAFILSWSSRLDHPAD